MGRGIVLALSMLLAACTAGPSVAPATPAPTPTAGTATTVTAPGSTHTDSAPAATGPAPAPAATGPAPAPGDSTPPASPVDAPVADDDAATARPSWLGTRPLPLRPDGYGSSVPTPPELTDRRFPPGWFLRRGGSTFESTTGPVPADVIARSTWRQGCPVPRDELSYLTMTFRGFDGESYVGEMIVASDHADGVVEAFRAMFEAGFPIEEMRVVAPAELESAPTGDGNTTTAFVCRPVTAGASWSQHAYGTAIDINPFHNPYVKGDLVLPELAGFYADRSRGLPGMITEGGVVVEAFDAIGWGWGGRWATLSDPQHFSVTGR